MHTHHNYPSIIFSHILSLLGKDLVACGPLHTKELSSLCDVLSGHLSKRSVVTHPYTHIHTKMWVSPNGQMVFRSLNVNFQQCLGWFLLCLLVLAVLFMFLKPKVITPVFPSSL